MSPMAQLLNLLWLLFGGPWAAIGWGITAVIRNSLGQGRFQHRRLHALAIRFEAVSRDDNLGRGDIGTGVLQYS